MTWLDATQLKAVDDTEFPDYRRAILPGGDFEMTMPSGERLSGALHLLQRTASSPTR
ncbi:hypothetical protein [Streptomyces sp. KL116D]|uniref:hypothetical protein n=1 Tax=Streptomyces sp. KL116D TaxID=3045152 RepID=UPI003557CBFC